jgi:hypothetical protein
VQFLEQESDHSVVHVVSGAVRLAVARGNQAVVVRIPTADATTYGGLLQRLIHHRQGLKPVYRASRLLTISSLKEGFLVRFQQFR